MYQLICKICNKPFTSNFKDVKICNDCKCRPCEVCGKTFNRVWPYDQRTCSAECRHKLRIDPSNIAQKEAKKKATVNSRYGVDNVSKVESVRVKISDKLKSTEVKDKLKKTSQEKYGVDDYRASSEVIEKRRKTLENKYGIDNVSKLESIRTIISERLKDPDVRKQYAETCIEHYGVPHPNLVPEVVAKREQTSIEHYGVPYYTMTDGYRSSQASNQISKLNKFVAELLAEKGIQTEFEFKIDNKFYDLHVVNSNIVLEIDPSYTHSNLPNHWCDGLPMDYHLKKSVLAEENGYRCIHLFDWDDFNKVMNLVQPKQILYARDCTLLQVDPKTISSFIETNHIQGNTKGATVAYGLYYNGELVCAMTFGKPRYSKKYEWELLRLCSNNQYRVVGGSSKIFKHFIEDMNPQSILSYCDKSKFTGAVYYKLGMKLDHISQPAKVWSFKDRYITDNMLRQRGFDQLFGTSFGKGTSNEELMIQAGWRSVYDCGQLVFEWIR